MTTRATVDSAMKNLLAELVKSKRDPGYVPFILVRGTPVGLPLRGRPFGTQQEAADRAREQLARSAVDAAWIVGRDIGIVQVYPRDYPVLGGRGVIPTDLSCPLCARAGYRTNAGDVPKLRVLENSDGKPFCVMHGYITNEDYEVNV